MSEAQLYTLGLGLSLLTSLLVVLYLRKPLHRILVELCGTEERAQFWTQITTMSYLMGAMFMALTYHPWEERPIHYYLSSMMGRTLFGLLATTAFLTIVIAIFAGITDSSKGKAGQQA